MKYRALKSFAVKIKMNPGDVREIDKDTAKDLIKQGYIEAVKKEAKK